MNPHSHYVDKKNQISFDPNKYKYYVLKKNMLLFRTQPEINSMNDVQPRICSDTGKCGTYLASSPYLSIAMMIEYKNLMKLGVFRVTENIVIPNGGKYSFRTINPQKYFDENGNLKKDIYPSPEENLSHVECEIYPLDDEDNIFLNEERMNEWENGLANCEVFLNPSDLKKVKLERVFKLNLKNFEELKRKIIELNFPLDLETYIKANILI